jgi:PKD repeat protein
VAFSNTIYAGWVGNYIGINLSGFPDNGQTYYWRVAASNSLGSSLYSSTWSFINGPSAVPATPTLSSPTNGSNVSGTTVSFNWNPAARAIDYYLQVARDAGFTNIVYGAWVGNYIGVNLSGFPDNGQTYYWRVAAWNSLGTSNYSATWSFVNGPSAPPAVPNLISPVNSANVSGTTISFGWSQAARAIDYYLQVATDEGFTNIIYGEWIGNYTGVNLSGFPDNGQTYYWRVAAWNSLGSSSYSSAWSFVNGPSALPDIPTLSLPANSSNAGGTTITFQWNPAARAADYYLEIATDTGFTDVVFGQWIGNYIGVDVTGFPDNGQTYYWRVTARNPLGQSPVSSAWSVINGPSSIPDIPTLSSPANSSNILGTTIQFQWAPAARANDYYLQIATDAGFTNLVFDSWLGGNYISVDMSGFPDNGQVYYWRVAAGNSLGSSSYSTVWSFINGPSAIPETPTLVSPANGANVSGTTILFQWNQAARANDYYLQVATDAGFANTVFGQWVGNYIGVNLSGFANNGQTYYWRVAARNSLGTSPYSSTWSFTNGTPPPSTCSSVYGSGIGVLGDNKTHIDTCRDSGSGIYYLYDSSRRANNNPHGHNGQMLSNAGIETSDYSSGVMVDNDNVWDAANQASGVDAHVYAAKVYDYLLNSSKGWSLNSFDGNGSSMNTMVEYSSPNAAGWNRNYLYVYLGVGSDKKPFSGALDAVGHEWAHGVTQYASNLNYEKESGALNEAFSDWMGTAVEYFYGESNWTIGEGIVIIRDLQNPLNPILANVVINGQTYDFRQPDTYGGYLWYPTIGCTPTSYNDWCGVHTNSGVSNKMFYLLSQGGTHSVSNITVQGIGIVNAIKIAFKANDERWPNNATFQNALDGMVFIANRDFSTNEVYQVKNAWAAVGVGTIPVVTANASTGGTVSGSGSYSWGATVALTATPNTGYAFVNWTENGVEVSTSASYTFTADGDRTLVANFSPAPVISVTPASWDFGSYYVWSPSPYKTVTVTNVGLQSLTIQSISITGIDPLEFSYIDMCTGDILSPSFGSCTIDVQFLPTSVGIKNANLSILSNDPQTPVLNVPLVGIGLNNPPTSNPGGPYSGIEGQAITLNGNSSTDSDGSIVLYEWDINNDGSYEYSSSSPTQNHAYAQQGTYTIKLRVTDNLGATGTATTTATISDTSPTTNFTASPTSGTTPLTVNFYNSSTGYDQPLSYAWDFDNNGTIDSTAQNPSYSYTNLGTYTVKLTITDSDGSTNTLTRTNYITVTETCLSPVRIAGQTPVYYSTLQEAYNAAVGGDIIQSQAVTLTENLNFNLNKSVILDGGYDCGYTSNTGKTILNGNLIISDGTVTIENLIIQ